jgi:osmotically-inducible protein OsmY
MIRHQQSLISSLTRPLGILAAVTLLAVLVGGACATNRPAGQQVGDAAITTKIKAKLTADPQINPFNIDVDTQDGVVTLRGRVEREVAREEAGRLARDTRGVVRVDNQIEVGAPRSVGERASDSWIATKVKGKLTADPELNSLNIDVDVKDGVVTLSGLVKNSDHRRHAEQLARDTEGVVRVENQLRVRENR